MPWYYFLKKTGGVWIKSIPDVLDELNSGYRLLFENDKLRVMEQILEPGQVSPMHNHPNVHAVYILSDAHLKLSYPEGYSSTYDLEEGKILWLRPGPYLTENIGNTVVHNIVTEVK